MSKFYEIIKEECDFQYSMYTIEFKKKEKSEFLSRFSIAYILQERCACKSDFEVVVEYLKLYDEMKKELNKRLEIFGAGNASTKDIAKKLEELDVIGYFLKKE